MCSNTFFFAFVIVIVIVNALGEMKKYAALNFVSTSELSVAFQNAIFTI